VKHKVKNSRVPLPAIILTNAQFVRYKLDELHGLIHTPRKYRSTWAEILLCARQHSS